jgi:hypothetical protein
MLKSYNVICIVLYNSIVNENRRNVKYVNNLEMILSVTNVPLLVYYQLMADVYYKIYIIKTYLIVCLACSVNKCKKIDMTFLYFNISLLLGMGIKITNLLKNTIPWHKKSKTKMRLFKQFFLFSENRFII